MRPEVEQAEWRPKLGCDQVPGSLRHEDLATVAGGADPGRTMDVEADVALGCPDRLARVDAHPVPYGDPVRPFPGRDCELAVDRGLDRRSGALEHEIQPIAGRAPLERTVDGERFADQPMVIGQHRRIPVPEDLEQPRRALDVGEHEGDGPGRLAGFGGFGWWHAGS